MVRKLPLELECPLDNAILDIVEYTNPIFYGFGFTPNGLTTLSALFGIAASISCFYDYYLLSSGLYFIGYFFDCADGNFARSYSMTSKFGDLYDHIKDLLVSFSLMGVLIYKFGFNLFNNLLIVLFSFLFAMNNLYLSQQNEQFEGETSDFLRLFTVRSNVSLKYLRFFGCATLNTYVCIVILILGYII